MEMTTIYSSPNCRPCRQTKLNLDKAGIPYLEIDISTESGAAERLRERGYRQTPVVESPVGTWSGMDEVKIQELIEFELGGGV